MELTNPYLAARASPPLPSVVSRSVLSHPNRSFLLVEEGEDDGGEQRRHAEVVVRQAGQDR